MYLEMGRGQGTPGYADCAVLRLSVHSSVVWGRGSTVRRADSRPANLRSEGRRSFGGSQGLCVWGWGCRVGGPVSSSCPSALSPLYPLQSRASAPLSHQWSLEGGRRQEAGTRGWSGGGGREGGGAGGRQGQRPGRCWLRRSSSLGLRAFFCLLVGAVSSAEPFAGPGLA